MKAKALESKARRAAKHAGLYAKKSRWHVGTSDNLGEFMLLDPSTGFPMAGFQYDMNAEEVIEYCAE